MRRDRPEPAGHRRHESSCRSAAEGTSASDLSAQLNSRIIALPLPTPWPHRRRGPTRHRWIRSAPTASAMTPPASSSPRSATTTTVTATALQLIDAAQAAGADCAKFQMRDMSRLYRNAGDSNDMTRDLGTQYTLDLLSAFSSVTMSCSAALTMPPAKAWCPCAPPGMKPASPSSTPGDGRIQGGLRRFHQPRPAHKPGSHRQAPICSTGMASEVEIRSGIRHLQNEGADAAPLQLHLSHPVQGRQPALPRAAAQPG